MIRSFLNDEKWGRTVLLTATCFMWLLILILFKYYGYEQTWQLWKVPTETPPFLDFRLIPGSAESFRHGFEPTVRNPFDPAHRSFNYPFFWRLFFYTGISMDDTIWAVVTMLVLFFVSIFLFPEKITPLSAIMMLLVIFSPACMLLYERGNVDLIVFFLCVLTVISIDYSPFITVLILIFAAIVKLFPFFGVIVLIKESQTRFIWIFLGAIGILSAYVFVTLKSVEASWNLTMRGRDVSYGANLIFQHYNDFFLNLLGVPADSTLLKYGPIGLAAVLVILTGVMGVFAQGSLSAFSDRNLAAFRMGASVFIGTFLLGNNWDYRLVFLILVIPQILNWGKAANQRAQFLSIATLALVFISCWHFVVWYAPALEDLKEVLFVFDELANWMLLAALSYWLGNSMPDWVKEQFRLLTFSRG